MKSRSHRGILALCAILFLLCCAGLPLLAQTYSPTPRPCAGYDITLVNTATGNRCGVACGGGAGWCADCTCPFDSRAVPVSVQLNFSGPSEAPHTESQTVSYTSMPPADGFGVRHFTCNDGQAHTLQSITIGGCTVQAGDNQSHLIPVPGVPGLCYKISLGYNYNTPGNPSGCPAVVDICTVACDRTQCEGSGGGGSGSGGGTLGLLNH